MRFQSATSPASREVFCPDEDVAELSLLLPARQAQALVEAASRRGMSVAQLVRQLTREFLRRHQVPPKG
jgi:hypothetical protein